MCRINPHKTLRWGKLSLPLGLTVVILLNPAGAAFAAEAQKSTTSTNLLLIDRFGKPIITSTNEVPASLHPPASVGLGQQVPSTPKGASMADPVRERVAESKIGRQWFPTTPPVLMPYLGGLDEFGNTAIQPGAVFPIDPQNLPAQQAKYALSELGLRYQVWQSFTMVSMTDVAAGASALQYYTATFLGKWALSEVPDEGRATWLSTEANAQLGLSPSSRTQSPQRNLGTIVNPLATVFGPNGVWVSELAWQESLVDGKVVFLAGLVDQSNYLDANTYANNSQGQLLNSAFVNSLVLPFPFNNLGLNLQWQPSELWYLLLGTGANNQLPGDSPFSNLSFDNWSYLLELGFTLKDVLGLGPGNYRLQPFLATVHAHTQAGIGLNVGQQLGANSPLAWFGRFGVGGTQVALGGASAQIATGLALQAPLKQAGLFPKLSNDYLAAGFIWSRASSVIQRAAHQNEYGFETTYVLQLTPLTSIQPDLQVVWDPAGNPNANANVIFQLQLNLTW
jgi:carbohydrate-selective porin OprB